MTQASLIPFLQDYPLPAGWSEPEVFVEKVTIGTCVISLVGLTSRHRDRVLTGSAADSEEAPFRRSYFELLERIAVDDFIRIPKATYPVLTQESRFLKEIKRESLFPASPTSLKWTYSKSNGVATHMTFELAAESAKKELIERDSLLRSWYGEILPYRLAFSSTLLEKAAEFYTFETYRFGFDPFFVVAIFGFPKNERFARVYGCGTSLDKKEALEHAERECLQGMGFLWEQEIPSEEPPFSSTPLFHQEYYLLPKNHIHLKNWLNGVHGGSISKGTQPQNDFGFVDITPDSLKLRLRVVKGISPDLEPLYFGINPEKKVAGCSAVHPFS